MGVFVKRELSVVTSSSFLIGNASEGGVPSCAILMDVQARALDVFVNENAVTNYDGDHDLVQCPLEYTRQFDIGRVGLFTSLE